MAGVDSGAEIMSRRRLLVTVETWFCFIDKLGSSLHIDVKRSGILSKSENNFALPLK